MPLFKMDISHNLDGAISRNRTRQWDFEYDEAGRLTRALLDHGTAFWCEYDREGRRERDVVTFRKDKARSFAYGPDNRLQTAGNTRFEHDPAGFRCARIEPDGKTWRYHYNPDYQLLGATLPDGRSLSYGHDADGRRIAKYEDGRLVQAYRWRNFLQLAGFSDGLGQAEFRYEPGRRMPSAMERGGAEYGLYYDQIGSLRAVADPLGNVVKEVLYSPFGAVIEDTNPGFSIPFGFAGGLFDRDLGFVRFGWRDYDPDTARWTAKDPIGAAGGDSDWYGYCLDDPVNGNDPSGLFRFAKRPLDGAVVNKMSGTGAISTLTSVAFPKLSLPFKGKLHELDDKTDTQFVHEQGFYGYKPQDKVGKPGNVEVESVGFFKDGIRKNNSDEAKRTDFVFEDKYYDDNTIRKALKRIEPEFPAGSYNLPTNPFKPKKNCQDFTTRLREEYGKVSREENLKKGKEWSGR